MSDIDLTDIAFEELVSEISNRVLAAVKSQDMKMLNEYSEILTNSDEGALIFNSNRFCRLAEEYCSEAGWRRPE